MKQTNINIINLTPHSIRLYRDDNSFEDFPSKGIARCTQESTLLEYIGTIPVYKQSYGDVYGLPEPQEDTIYIVSYIVARAVKGKRNDVYTVTNTVRDGEGNIIGFKCLSRI